ncbi:hypothetical protein [Phaffia rhodozyma]|uniref:Uncharacterized protein n=1 Tax=Phaffia rhodozyma TaxID=264483 RepID=A0A0F7SHX8_PHARH|nr:hypothetical protein [Phaffia rhodozyma]
MSPLIAEGATDDTVAATGLWSPLWGRDDTLRRGGYELAHRKETTDDTVGGRAKGAPLSHSRAVEVPARDRLWSPKKAAGDTAVGKGSGTP